MQVAIGLAEDRADGADEDLAPVEGRYDDVDPPLRVHLCDSTADQGQGGTQSPVAGLLADRQALTTLSGVRAS
jgi:uncharacterized protein YndB with AHSA1/START domain